MKVQIEIPKKAINLAIAQISMNAKGEDDLLMLDQAVERCNKEVIDLDLDDLDEEMTLRIALAFAAIAQQVNKIEQDEKQ